MQLKRNTTMTARVLRHQDARSGLIERPVFTLYSREEFELSWEKGTKSVQA